MTGIPGVILAGGLARRMGGGDKGLLQVGDRTLLDHVVARITPQVGALALNVNGDTARFKALNLPVISDSIKNYAGPLAGVLAGLDWAAEQGAQSIVTVAADTPFFPRDLVARLQASAGDAFIVLAATPGDKNRPLRHPTFGLWPVALRDDLRAALNDGLRKVVLWTDKHGAATAMFDGNDPFFNVNTPADLDAARSLLAKEPS